MSAPLDDTLATLVARAGEGDELAKAALFAALYADLHRLAQVQLRRSGGQPTLSATTLLHEAYLDIAKRDAAAFPDRQRFLAYASRDARPASGSGATSGSGPRRSRLERVPS